MNKLGAELAINYNKNDFEKVVNEYTNNEGINIILDIIGADYFNKNLNILAKNGKLLVIAFQGGFEGKLNLLPVLKKWLTVTGSTLRPRSVEEKGLIAESLYEKVWPLLEKKVVMPQIYGSYKLEDATKA
jgi:NADPH2:quinone reductase